MIKMIHHSGPRERGFTLIEMMIAIAIFALLSLGAYQILQGVLRSDEISKERGLALKKLQRAMLFVERDMQQMDARIQRNDDELTAKALQSGRFLFDSDEDGITFVRLGWRNPISMLPRSSSQRVSYRIKGEQLQRLSFIYLDPAVGEEPKIQVLLSGVTALTFMFHDGKKWQEAWSGKDTLPNAVKMKLTSSNFGDIERSFILPKAVANATTKSSSS